ncbi:MAG: hypothetical protein WCL43_02265 [Chlorobium sp.]|jgi:THUMP domain-like/Conserved hypothetical protein 95|nr:MAG: hypothetical protein FDX12_08425 [Chlorobium sp.]
MILEELLRILEPEVQSFIDLHSADDPVAFAMKFYGNEGLPVRAIAEQIACRRKAAKKLPHISRNNLLYTPLALEQASGERTAAYKSSVMRGKRVIDLSGGLGIDTMFLARTFREVVYCERDSLLCNLFEHNLKQGGISNVQIINSDSIGVLASYPDDYFDWIYVDPARREQGKRSIGLEAASPDVVAFHDILLCKSERVCIKASPALELSGLNKLLPALYSVIVVSFDRECKEILLLLDRNCLQSNVSLKAVCLSSATDAVTEVVGNGDDEKNIASFVKAYFYEPDPAIIKAKLTARLAAINGLEFVNKTVDYLTSERELNLFPGRMFRKIDCTLYKPKTFRTFLERHKIEGASIQRRDFPLSPEELRKKYRLQESDQVFLFFTRDFMARPVVVFCHRFIPTVAEVLFEQDRNADPGY